MQGDREAAEKMAANKWIHQTHKLGGFISFSPKINKQTNKANKWTELQNVTDMSDVSV